MKTVTRTHRRPLVALLLALVVVATATLGSAATLTVNAASISALTVTHPCPGTLAATTPTTTGTATTVEVTPPAACAGLTIAVAVSDGAVVRQGTAPAPASGSVTVTLDGAYTPSTTTQVAATASGWHLDTTWSYTPPPSGPAITCTTTDPARPCEAEVVLRDSWAGGYNLDITIRDTRTGNANNPVEWTITLDFSHPMYPFVPNGIEGSGVVAQSTCGDLPVLTLTGVTNWGEHHQLRRGTVRTVWIQPVSTGSGSVLSCP